MSDLQPGDEWKCEYLLTTVRDFGQLTPEEVDVGLEAIFEPHFDGEEVITTPFGFLARGVLCEKDFDDLPSNCGERAVVGNRATLMSCPSCWKER